MALSPHAIELVHKWLALDTQADTRAEAEHWLQGGNETTVLDRLTKRLEFGTAGLRGRMGAGTNAMNRVVVQQTTQGLCVYLQQQEPHVLAERGVVIGYDGRHHSRDFALVAAAVFVSRGVRVHLFGRMVPTPFVAAGVSELRAATGIQVTASHNPKADNGYKVYWGNGCQIIPPHDEGIAAAILANTDLWPLPDLSTLTSHPLVHDPWEGVTAAYYKRIAALSVRGRAANATAQPVTYTPLHGVGAEPLLRAFQVAGLPAPHVVPSQALPDPEFPTVVFPNPEEGAGTWAAAFQEGRAQGSRLVLANDPDADRLAVAEADPSVPGGYRAFTGNEIGALMGWWLWQHRDALTPPGQPAVPASRHVMCASVVSSAFLGAMAAREGFEFVQTLTGFKWLGNRALELQAQGYKVLFAFEEAIGFMPGDTMYPDKDGMAAAMVMAEAAAQLYASGSSLAEQLRALYAQYGTPAYRSGYFLSDSPAKTRAVFDRLRGDTSVVTSDGTSGAGQYATSLAGQRVQWVRDLGTGRDTSQPDGTAVLPWRAGDPMITWGVPRGVVTLRASGTEPKLKYYLEVLDSDVARGAALADALVTAVDTELVRVEASGLTRPVH